MAAAEVFKVQVEAGEHRFNLFYEFIDEGVVRVVVDAFLTQTEVEGIVEEALTVGTGIDDDGQNLGRIDSGSSRIDHEFPRRDADAVGAQSPIPKMASASVTTMSSISRPMAVFFKDSSICSGCSTER